MELWHHLAQRALVVTKPRRGAVWSTAGRGGLGRSGRVSHNRAGLGLGVARLGWRRWGRAGWSGVRLGRAWPGRQCEEHLAMAAACVEAM
jgi:hypothetical protein